MRPPLPLSALSLAVLAAFAPLSHAQSADETEKTTVLPTVVVTPNADASAEGLQPAYAGGQVARGGRVGVLGQQDNLNVPFSITSYTHELIQDQQAASVGEILLNDPAVRVARGFGNFQQTYIVRGQPVYSDDMSYNGLYGLLPRQYLAAELVERVEVLRGASAFLNGAAPGGSGLGGAVNVVPKRAANDRLLQFTAGTQSGGQAYLAGDASDRYLDGRLGLRSNFAYRNGDTAVDGESRTLGLFSLGADYRYRDLRISADIGYQINQVDNAQPSVTIGAGLPILEAPDASRSVGQSWTYSDERDFFGTLRAEYDFTPAVTGWIAGGGRLTHEANSLANPTVIAANGDSTAYRFDNARRDAVMTGEAGMRGNFRTGEVGHTVVASGALYQKKERNAYAFSDFGGFANNIYHPTAVAAPPATFFVGGDMDDPKETEKVNTASFALADTLALLNDRLLVTVGARYQNIENVAYDVNTGAQLGDGYSESAVTPVAGVVYKFTPALSAYASYIEGLVKGDTAPTESGGRPISNGGEVLSPYKTEQFEIGMKYDGGRIGGTVSAYQSRKPMAGVNGDVYEIVDHQRTQGLELSAYGEALPGLKVLGGLSLMKTDLDGKDAIGSPPVQANLGLEWSVPQVRNLSFDGRVIYTSSQYADAANLQEVPSWTRLDLGARYLTAVGNQLLTVRGRIENVTNENYWASSGGYPGYGYLTVGAPRTVVVSATMDF